MGNGPRDYTEKTLKRLFALSGNYCAFPGCNKRLVNNRNAKDSNICHIEGANVGGERYNPNMTDEQRADYDNLILLCIQHHDETNDETKYTVDILKKMKSDHESQFLIDKINRNPSMLKNTITAISEIALDEYRETPVLNIVDPNQKISFNMLKRNSSIIREYTAYHSKLNTLYDELEQQASIKKEKLLQNIKIIYENVKADYIMDTTDPIQIIRLNSDQIFDKVYDILYHKLDDSGLWDEDIILGVRVVLVDAFIRCKVLEEPK
jgi:hypothetical protein